MVTEAAARPWHRHLDVAVNIVALVVGIVTITYVVHSYQAHQQQPHLLPGITKGMTAPLLSGIDYAKADQTLLLVLRSSCQYCRADIPFYKNAAESARKSGKTQIVTVFEKTDPGARGFLNNNGLELPMIEVANLESLRAHATPTLILVDHKGRVEDFWVGAVAQTSAPSILGRL